MLHPVSGETHTFARTHTLSSTCVRLEGAGLPEHRSLKDRKWSFLALLREFMEKFLFQKQQE